LNILEIELPELLAEMAYNTLWNACFNRHFMGDEVYSEMARAKERNLSRTPVRAALFKLSSQDGVAFLTRRDVIVNNFPDRVIEEVFELRKAIELVAME
jgi:DNA-binding GntR family transcriptional regulator